MVQVYSQTEQARQINDLNSYVEDYCSAKGLDPSIYTAALNSQTIDPNILKDPVFQAYWQLTHLQLMEIVNPTIAQSFYAEVEQIDFDAVYPKTGDEMTASIQNLVDELSVEGTTSADSSTVQAGTRMLASTKGTTTLAGESSDSSGGNDYTDEDARELAEELGLDGMWDFLIETEEGSKSSENYLLEGLAEMDEQLTALQEALELGEMSAEEFSAGVEQISAYRQLYVGLIQNFEDAFSNLLQTFSQLLKAEEDGQMAILRNLSVSA